MHLAGKTVHPHWIEHGLLDRWRRGCDAQHNEECQQGFTKDRLVGSHPTWLIDTWTLCLVHGHLDMPYVALSYVWGPPDFYKTSRRDLAMLQQVQAFHHLKGQSLVPQTIIDAFAVTQLLGQRYLWVDSLCIVQDDEEMKAAEIINMSYIYAQATITIIARQGKTAKYGLRGFPGTSQPRHTSQDLFRIDKKYRLLKSPQYYGYGCEWDCRGWTYQEEVFSRRRLIFYNDRVWWECQCSKFQEDIHTPPGSRKSLPSRIPNESRIFSSDILDLEGYRSLVTFYNTRQFTIPEDVVPAFAGITAVLTPSFKGFLFGLPLLSFDTALCWQPFGMPGIDCKRRGPRNPLIQARSYLPSWSWMGWQTHIDHHSMTITHARKRYGNYRHSTFNTSINGTTKSIIRWYSKERDSTKLHPIDGPRTLEAVMAEGFKEDGTLPTGWRRIEYKDREWHDHVSTGFTPPKYLFIHESEPESEFWFPVPTAQDYTDSPALPLGNLLCCKTQKSSLLIGRRRVIKGKNPLKLEHDLLDKEMRWSGIIQLHNTNQLPLENEDISTKLALPCDLVVISEGFVLEGSRLYSIPGWEFDERPKGPHGTKYEFFNVLWVEWEDDIAYRKGCGRVMKSAWDAQDPEWIDLTLG
ncbi:HET-domain-containing protein [Mollisia scopiformis]|uniref:HET-domain-containing protein n=1 Tax=Mollisia scopiformis TaxID=149040 RepID=A0A194WT78_MOLSC|nr:HET-domain-containing protein [Mollisia scopiformis]KUJ11163.1 HET-domain-containing protein [Mollisia scopiformis]